MYLALITYGSSKCDLASAAVVQVAGICRLGTCLANIYGSVGNFSGRVSVRGTPYIAFCLVTSAWTPNAIVANVHRAETCMFAVEVLVERIGLVEESEMAAEDAMVVFI